MIRWCAGSQEGGEHAIGQGACAFWKKRDNMRSNYVDFGAIHPRTQVFGKSQPVFMPGVKRCSSSFLYSASAEHKAIGISSPFFQFPSFGYQ
jgi:hypothetical protein